MEDDFHAISNPMLTLDEYYSQIQEEEKIDLDDMFYDEVVKPMKGKSQLKGKVS